ncbi:MAG: RhuM family protein, partial [bacterium]
ERLREYLIKGFTLDDDRLKGRDRLADYFDELLARIREIRASEKRVYQRIREIFALASDYVEGEQKTQVFFATMQNKMHYAAAGMTAAEIVRRRADSRTANMGLTSWSGSRVLKRDVMTAKNYLNEKEIDTLNRIVVMFLDQAEFRAQRRQDIKMQDWTAFLDKFLRDTELPVLGDAGSVSREDALAWANEQYDAFTERRRLEAETMAEERYLDDLRTSAKTLEAERKKPSLRKKTQGKRHKKNDKN